MLGVSSCLPQQNAADDPYFRSDPGPGIQRITVHRFDIEKDFDAWEAWRTNDGRVLHNPEKSFTLVKNPFEPGSLIQITTRYDPAVARRPFGGSGIKAPIEPALALNSETFVQFDLYYPRSAADKYMRLEIWSVSSGGEGSQDGAGSNGTMKTQVYIRTDDLDGIGNLNPQWSGYYNDETWFKKSVSAPVPVPAGSWEYLNIDLHTETGTKVAGELLMIGSIRITQTAPEGVPIPDVVNTRNVMQVTPIKEKYNPNTGHFLMGTVGTGAVTAYSLRGRHYELFVDGGNLKPHRHLRPPQWLRDEFPDFSFEPDTNGPEWNLPTSQYLRIRESGKPSEYKMHGHVLAWYNQSPPWMRQIVPENVTSTHWNSDGLFYAYGNNSKGPFQKVNRNLARRVYFNHILYEMRHFMTADTRYNSSKERGIIPFHSFDVLNEEIHESRHSLLIKDNPDEWKSALKHLSWLMAMTDNDISDIRQHYIYLLFKYAHIAVPNAQMAEKYKAGYNDPQAVPDYMKLDNHDDNGSIDAYITARPPVLVYNDYDIALRSKATVACNMIRELNFAWRTDPLYDGRNLIECMGIQGHDTISPTLASQNLHSVALYAGLIDDGLLDWICYSELDLKLPDSAPGGGALAPAVLNQKQADVIGYQYALLFKVFEQYKRYIDHILIWGQYGSGWQNSYVPFDHQMMASQAYYGIMDPDRFIKGHSYLDYYFAGEHAAVSGF
ncbi:MAG: endo-1,4-beta-xylanase [Treponema sp.]|nr:endo-1,4-beta-xylanase [Treponema sp.]